MDPTFLALGGDNLHTFYNKTFYFQGIQQKVVEFSIVWTLEDQAMAISQIKT